MLRIFSIIFILELGYIHSLPVASNNIVSLGNADLESILQPLQDFVGFSDNEPKAAEFPSRNDNNPNPDIIHIKTEFKTNMNIELSKKPADTLTEEKENYSLRKPLGQSIEIGSPPKGQASSFPVTEGESDVENTLDKIMSNVMPMLKSMESGSRNMPDGDHPKILIRIRKTDVDGGDRPERQNDKLVSTSTVKLDQPMRTLVSHIAV